MQSIPFHFDVDGMHFMLTIEGTHLNPDEVTARLILPFMAGAVETHPHKITLRGDNLFFSDLLLTYPDEKTIADIAGYIKTECQQRGIKWPVPAKAPLQENCDTLNLQIEGSDCTLSIVIDEIGHQAVQLHGPMGLCSVYPGNIKITSEGQLMLGPLAVNIYSRSKLQQIIQFLKTHLWEFPRSLLDADAYINQYASTRNTAILNSIQQHIAHLQKRLQQATGAEHSKLLNTLHAEQARAKEIKEAMACQ